MAEDLHLSDKHRMQIEANFFATKEEILGTEQFALLFQNVFDYNWDGVLQYAEFRDIVKYMPITDDQEDQAIAKFFPEPTDELDADKYDELMKFLNGCLEQQNIAK